MKIKFTSEGQLPAILSKEKAEAMMRRTMDDDRVDLILMRVMTGTPVTLSKNNLIVTISLVEEK